MTGSPFVADCVDEKVATGASLVPVTVMEKALVLLPPRPSLTE